MLLSATALSSCVCPSYSGNGSLTFCDTYEPLYRTETEAMAKNEATFACECLKQQYAEVYVDGKKHLIDCL